MPRTATAFGILWMTAPGGSSCRQAVVCKALTSENNGAPVNAFVPRIVPAVGPNWFLKRSYIGVFLHRPPHPHGLPHDRRLQAHGARRVRDDQRAGLLGGVR